MKSGYHSQSSGEKFGRGDALRIDDLVAFVDKEAILRMSDGEVATVRVNSVDREYDDIIVDVVETSRPERYLNRTAAYTFAAKDIVSVEIKR